MLKLHPDELVRLAPRLKPYLRRPSPAWPELVEAADWLRHDLDVSKSLWGEVCLAMGREQAAIALAVVSTKDPAHFRTTPGGYFHGMVTKAKAGELNLDRTLWAMRRAAEPKPPPKIARKGAEGPNLRKLPVRNKNTSTARAFSTREEAGTFCLRHKAASYCVQSLRAIGIGWDAVLTSSRPAYCTQQTGGPRRGITLRAIQASDADCPGKRCAVRPNPTTQHCVQRNPAVLRRWAFRPVRQDCSDRRHRHGPDIVGMLCDANRSGPQIPPPFAAGLDRTKPHSLARRRSAGSAKGA